MFRSLSRAARSSTSVRAAIAATERICDRRTSRRSALAPGRAAAAAPPTRAAPAAAAASRAAAGAPAPWRPPASPGAGRCPADASTGPRRSMRSESSRKCEALSGKLSSLLRPLATTAASGREAALPPQELHGADRMLSVLPSRPRFWARRARSAAGQSSRTRGFRSSRYRWSASCGTSWYCPIACSFSTA